MIRPIGQNELAIGIHPEPAFMDTFVGHRSSQLSSVISHQSSVISGASLLSFGRFSEPSSTAKGGVGGGVGSDGDSRARHLDRLGYATISDRAP